MNDQLAFSLLLSISIMSLTYWIRRKFHQAIEIRREEEQDRINYEIQANFQRFMEYYGYRSKDIMPFVDFDKPKKRKAVGLTDDGELVFDDEIDVVHKYYSSDENNDLQ